MSNTEQHELATRHGSAVGKSLSALLSAGVLMLTSCGPAIAEDAAAIYKSKCATCHSADGSGRKVMKGTNLLSEEVRKKSDAELAYAIANGGSKKDEGHAYEKRGITAAQTKTLVAHIRELQKKSR